MSPLSNYMFKFSSKSFISLTNYWIYLGSNTKLIFPLWFFQNFNLLLKFCFLSQMRHKEFDSELIDQWWEVKQITVWNEGMTLQLLIPVTLYVDTSHWELDGGLIWLPVHWVYWSETCEPPFRSDGLLFRAAGCLNLLQLHWEDWEDWEDSGSVALVLSCWCCFL